MRLFGCWVGTGWERDDVRPGYPASAECAQSLVHVLRQHVVFIVASAGGIGWAKIVAGQPQPILGQDQAATRQDGPWQQIREALSTDAAAHRQALQGLTRVRAG